MQRIVVFALSLIALPAIAQERVFRAAPLDVQQNIRLDSLEEKVGLLGSQIDMQQAETLDRLGSIERTLEGLKAPATETASVAIAAKPEPKPASDAPAKATVRLVFDPISGVSTDKPTVVMLSIPGCGWCDEYEINRSPSLKAKRWRFERVNDNRMQFAKYPSFRVFDGKKWHTHVGYMQFDDLREILGQPVFAKASTPAAATQSSRYSSSELRALIQQHRPGGWSGPVYADVSPRSSAKRHLQDPKHGFTADQLAGLTQEEALILHDLAPTHGNKIFPTRSGTQPARRQSSVTWSQPLVNQMETGCANGQCARGAKARSGLFGFRSR